MMTPAMPCMAQHHGVAVPPVVTVAATRVRVARSVVLAVRIRIELGAPGWIFDNRRRCQSGSCKGCRGDSGGANQCEFHLIGLLDCLTKTVERALGSVNFTFDFADDHSGPFAASLQRAEGPADRDNRELEKQSGKP
jgi:hypothetical protein